MLLRRQGHTVREVIDMKKKPSSNAERIAAQVPHVFPEPAEPIHSDVQGSYTGDPLYDEQPVQDADDL